jgi:hypothetical protein
MEHLYDNLSNTIREIVKYEVEQALKALKQEVIKDLVNTNPINAEVEPTPVEVITEVITEVEPITAEVITEVITEVEPITAEVITEVITEVELTHTEEDTNPISIEEVVENTEDILNIYSQSSTVQEIKVEEDAVTISDDDYLLNLYSSTSSVSEEIEASHTEIKEVKEVVIEETEDVTEAIVVPEEDELIPEKEPVYTDRQKLLITSLANAGKIEITRSVKTIMEEELQKKYDKLSALDSYKFSLIPRVSGRNNQNLSRPSDQNSTAKLLSCIERRETIDWDAYYHKAGFPTHVKVRKSTNLVQIEDIKTLRAKAIDVIKEERSKGTNVRFKNHEENLVITQMTYMLKDFSKLVTLEFPECPENPTLASDYKELYLYIIFKECTDVFFFMHYVNKYVKGGLKSYLTDYCFIETDSKSEEYMSYIVDYFKDHMDRVEEQLNVHNTDTTGTLASLTEKLTALRKQNQDTSNRIADGVALLKQKRLQAEQLSLDVQNLQIQLQQLTAC